MLEYREHPPQPVLKDHIVCFWSMVSCQFPQAKPQNHRVLPDCCADIIFDFTGARGRSPAYVVGTMTRPILFTTNGEVDMLGIRFRPGASRPFLQVSIDKCTDLATDLDCFWGPAGPELWSRLAESRDTAKRIALIESHLLKQYGWNMALDPYVQFCVKLMERRRGIVTAKDLEKGTGLSSRQIERKFDRDIGIGPKAYSRILRFQNIIQRASEAESLDWPLIALRHGYSDQSHLIRDFKDFSGVTPSAFIAER
mgnify:CR=1 FL=1